MSELLTAASRAHHDATGGPDHDWASWYAGFLQHDLEPWLGVDLEQLSTLLRLAADKHPVDTDVRPWPTCYAESILESLDQKAEGPG